MSSKRWFIMVVRYVDVLYFETFFKMGYMKENMSPPKDAIYGFTNTKSFVVGLIDLKISIGSQMSKASWTT